MDKKKVIKSIVNGAALVIVARVVEKRVRAKVLREVDIAVGHSCRYEIPVEDRKLSCEDMARAAVYREMLKLERRLEEVI